MTTNVNLSDEDLFLAITGAGAFQFGEAWYSKVIEIDPLCWAVSISLHGERGTGLVTPDSIRAAISELRTKYPNTEAGLGDIDLSDPECDSDFDCIAADAVIQQIVLGDVVFG